MVIVAYTGCKHTEALEVALTDSLNDFRAAHPDHEQQFLAVTARVIGSLMALHMFNGVPDDVVESIVKENMRFAIAEQIKQQLTGADSDIDPNHPGTETKQ